MSQSDPAAASGSNGDQDGQKERLPPGLVCPACGSRLIRRSMRRTLKDRFMSLLGRWPYRCQMCNMRFNGPQDPASIAREHARVEEIASFGDNAEEGDTPLNDHDKPHS
jgi:hypothetical protein